MQSEARGSKLTGKNMDVYTREYVESFLNHEPQSQQEVAAKASVIARGFAYYGNIKRKFPTHYSSFSHMH